MARIDPELAGSKQHAKPQLPRDAATLILVRRDGGAPRILLGQRHEAHAFMPNKYVFPGGRLDPQDSRVTPVRDLDAQVLAKLMARMRGRASASRARGLAIAAVRETFEETGLLYGRSALHEAPSLTGLRFFARAITPPGRTRRFDSRFFVGDAAEVSNLDHPQATGSGELLTLSWFTLDDALGLDLPSITKDILGRLRVHLERGDLPPHGAPASFQYMHGKRWREDSL